VKAAEPRCRTGEQPLYGGEIEDFEQFRETWFERLRQELDLDEEVATHLAETYGNALDIVVPFLAAGPDGSEKILPDLPFLWGELDYALAREMTVGLDDFVIRRTHLFSLDREQGQSIIGEVADRMALALGWSAEEVKRQKSRYLAKIEVVQGFRGLGRINRSSAS